MRRRRLGAATVAVGRAAIVALAVVALVAEGGVSAKTWGPSTAMGVTSAVAAAGGVSAETWGPASRATQVPAPPVDIRGHGVDPRLTARLAEAAAEMPPLPALPAAPGGNAMEPVVVHVAGSEAELARLTGGRIPEWGAGIAIPSERVVILPALGRRNRDPAALLRTMRHELAHIALNDALAPARIPRWFDEGYARWAAGEWSPTAEWRLRLAFALDRAPSLDSLTLGWPEGSVQADVAYLLATSAVGYLVEQGGEAGLATFLSRWRETGSMDRAMRRTYGRTLGQFEHDWQRRTRSRYGWAAALSHATVFWAFAAVLLVVLWVIRRRRNAARREALIDPPDRPAYWLGEDVYGPDAGEPPARPGE